MGGMWVPPPQGLFEPLTTLFTPPSNCFSPTYTLGSGSNDSWTVLTSGEFRTALIHGFTSSCSPTSAWDLISYYARVSTNAAYSPGICPYGWTTATASVIPPQTTALCCPTSWSLLFGSSVDAYNFTCTTTLLSPTVVGGDQTTTITTGAEGLMRGLVVRQDDSDSALIASVTASSSTTTSTAATTSSSSQLSTTATPGPALSSPTATSPSQTSSPSLSTGAKAGIGVGAAIAALTILAAIVLFLWRHKKRQQKDIPRQITDSSNTFEKAELSGEGKPVPELKANHLTEIDGTSRPGEMDNSTVRAELEGDWRGWEAPGRLG